MSDGRLTVLLDEGTPIMVAVPFSQREHGVIYFHEALIPGSKDDQVVEAAIRSDSALIAVDSDVKRLGRRFGQSYESRRYKNLSLIVLSCGPVMATKRIEQAMSFIEHEWEFACGKRARRLWVDIGPHRMTTYR